MLVMRKTRMSLQIKWRKISLLYHYTAKLRVSKNKGTWNVFIFNLCLISSKQLYLFCFLISQTNSYKPFSKLNLGQKLGTPSENWKQIACSFFWQYQHKKTRTYSLLKTFYLVYQYYEGSLFQFHNYYLVTSFQWFIMLSFSYRSVLTLFNWPPSISLSLSLSLTHTHTHTHSHTHTPSVFSSLCVTSFSNLNLRFA